jgi:hypothetical protein
MVKDHPPLCEMLPKVGVSELILMVGATCGRSE